jgi:hypothetical protein
MLVSCAPALTWQKDPLPSNNDPRPTHSSASPARLAGGAVSVRLQPRPQTETPAMNQKTFLILRGISTDRQPGTTYRIYLGPAPAKDQPGHLIGTLNFFNARPADKTVAGTPGSTRSFDITALAREQKALLAREPVITILPTSTPEAAAHPVIGSIEVAVGP